MSDEAVILIQLLKVQASQQETLIALLSHATETVIPKLRGWKTTWLFPAKDGSGLVIYSEWDSAKAVEAMRGDPRMKALIAQILELASLQTIVESTALSEARKSHCAAPRGAAQWL